MMALHGPEETNHSKLSYMCCLETPPSAEVISLESSLGAFKSNTVATKLMRQNRGPTVAVAAGSI